MNDITKLNLSFFGVDDELKNDDNSIYTTNINSTNFPILNYDYKTFTNNSSAIDVSGYNLKVDYNYQQQPIDIGTSNFSFINGEIHTTNYETNKYSNISTFFKNNRPWGAYFAEDYRNNNLFDISGNNRHATTTGTIYSCNLMGNGASSNIHYITGNTSSTITFPSGSVPTNFTILSLTRYNYGINKRIITATTGNFLHGHWEGLRGVAFYNNGWKTPQTSIGILNDWCCCIGKNGGSTPNNIIIDGVGRGNATGGDGNRTLTINNNPYTDYSDWAMSAVIIWDKHLADNDMVLLNDLINDYKSGVVNPRIFFPVYDYKYPILKNLDGTPINPVAWYKFDDNATKMLLDSSGNGNNLINNGATYDTTNLIRGNGSISFDGTLTKYTSLPFIPFHTYINNQGITFSLWVSLANTNGLAYRRIFAFFANGTNNNNNYIAIINFIGTRDYYFEINNGITYASTSRIITNVNLNTFYHIVWSISKTGVWTIYLNGSQIYSQSHLTSSTYLSTNVNNYFSKGADADLANFAGNIDDFRIYDRILTQEQVSQLYYGCHIDKSYPIIKRNGTTLNPLVWYKFDTSTNLGLDAMGNHNLTNNNSVGYNSIDTVKGTGSASFNGTNQFLSKSPAFNLNSKDFSICGWFKRTENGRNDMFLQLGTGATNALLHLAITTENKLQFAFYANDLISTSSYLDAGYWVHLVFTYKTGTRIRKIYRNGIQVANDTSTGELLTDNLFRLGTWPTAYYKGLMDDFRIYEYELTATEIQELYRGRVEVLRTLTNYPSYLNNKTVYSYTPTSVIYNDLSKFADNVDYLVEALPISSFQIKKNSKKFKFRIPNFTDLKLTNKAKLVIESITIPNIISKSFISSKCVNNIIFKIQGINNNLIYDSSFKNSGNSIIFSAPINKFTNGYGTTYSTQNLPDKLGVLLKHRIQTNNVYTFINPNPKLLYNFNITQDFIDNGEFIFELIYDIGSCLKNSEYEDEFIYVPQSLNNNDKDEFEKFMVKFLIMDENYDENIYNEKKLLNTINKLLL